MDKIEKLRLKAQLAEDSGDHQKAYNIRKKIKGLIAKAEYKKAKGPSGLSKIIKKVTSKGKEVVEKVKEEIPVIKKKEEKPPVVKTEEKKPEVKTSSQKISGTYGLAYGTDGKKGVGSVTIGDVTYKPGDDGFENASKQFLARIKDRETVQQKIKKIKKNRRK
tara:strand:+ start:638 stop:1126 length:489 start_codon:yes stop_codon:yes gene_type:complete